MDDIFQQLRVDLAHLLDNVALGKGLRGDGLNAGGPSVYSVKAHVDSLPPPLIDLIHDAALSRPSGKTGKGNRLELCTAGPSENV